MLSLASTFGGSLLAGDDEVVARKGGGATTLSVAMTDSSDPVITSVGFLYTIIVTNTGAAQATSLVVSVTLDASLSYVTSISPGSGWSVDESTLPVLTYTRSVGDVGALPAIVISVTSGAAALTTSSTANAIAANAPAAAPSTQTTVVKFVTQDATGGQRFPANATEWTDYNTYRGRSTPNPNSLWNCQDLSGNLVDAIGALTLTAAGASSYQQTIAGLARKAVALPEGAFAFRAASGVGPNPSTTSSLWILFSKLTAPASGTRVIVTAGGATTAANVATMVAPTTKIMINSCAAANVNGLQDAVAPGFQAIGLLYNRAGALTFSFDAVEKIAGTYSASVTDGPKGIGSPGIGITGAPQSVAYAMMWSGAAAEAMTMTEVQALLQDMTGVPIPWIANPIVAMPLGDSITHGAYQYLGGYRAPLVAARPRLQMVGRNSNFGFHEGYDGFKIAAISTKGFQAVPLYAPSVVFLIAGYNDLTAGTSVSTALSALRTLADGLIATAAVTTVFVGNLPANASSIPAIATFNAGLAAAFAGADPGIILVDTCSTLVYPTDMYDVTHPNTSGYAKVAAAWQAAVDARGL